MKYMTVTKDLGKKETFDKWNSKFPINSLDLMRGYISFKNSNKEKYFELCFDAYWKDDLDISNKEIINKILEKCKLDKSKFFEDIKKEKIKKELKDLTSNAFEKDIFGAPTFVVNEKIFWGQDRLDYALEEYNS